MARRRVFLGFVAGAFFAVFSHVASRERLLIGLSLSFLGLMLRAWAAGYLEKGKRLAQDGPYRFLRHPLYEGSFVMALGLCIAGTGSSRPWHGFALWCVFLFLFLWIYPKRVREEEISLEKYFGDAWREYARGTFRYLPRLRPLSNKNSEKFAWSRYKKNREYNALLGWIVGTGLLLAKAISGI